MSVRADVAELLHAGHSDRAIARQLGVDAKKTVAPARAALGIPKARSGYKAAASPADLFWRRTQPTDDGHLLWTGSRTNHGVPSLRHGGQNLSAYRVAFQIANGYEPTGYAHVVCERPDCIHPAHTADTAVTPRRGHHRAATGVKPLTSREDIVAQLNAGRSDRYISRTFGVNTSRVARIRAELGLPKTPPRTALSFEDGWAAATEPTVDGHLRWVGTVRDASPQIWVEGRRVSARRAAFEHLYGRPAKGPVLPGCGWGPCVRPDHLEDRPMREQLANQYDAIFGKAAA